MTSAEITRCLVAGGVSPDVLRGRAPDDRDAVPRYDGMHDIAGCAALAAELATHLRPAGADAIVIGSAVEDAVLAALTARELGIDIVRSYIDEGLLFAPQLRARTRLILLSDVFLTSSSLAAMWSLASERGSTVCAVASLYEIAPPALPDAGIMHVVLLRAGTLVSI